MNMHPTFVLLLRVCNENWGGYRDRVFTMIDLRSLTGKWVIYISFHCHHIIWRFHNIFKLCGWIIQHLKKKTNICWRLLAIFLPNLNFNIKFFLTMAKNLRFNKNCFEVFEFVNFEWISHLSAYSYQ